MLHRTKLFALSVLVLAIWLPASTLSNATTSSQLSMTGQSVPELARFDQFMEGFMDQWEIPGAALALMKDGRLVFARGYGIADQETGEVVQPNSLFRIGSVSKPITSAATHLLIDRGELSLSDRAFEILSHIQPFTGMLGDARYAQITVEHLLTHSAGLRPNPDPMFEANMISEQLGIEGPPTCAEIISYATTIPLIYMPGTDYVYSNFGYCVLSEIIAAVSGMSYEQLVRNELLSPIGITQMQIGASLWEDRVEGETRSHPYEGAPLVESIFPAIEGPVEFPYGGINLEASAGPGGWLASPVDLVRLVAALEQTREPYVLSAEAVDQMTARPLNPIWSGSSTYYAQGWMVRSFALGRTWWHNGALPYNAAYLKRRGNDGVTYAVTFNSHPNPSLQGAFFERIELGLENAITQTSTWPDHDLFAMYLGSATQDDNQDPAAEALLEPTITVCADGCDFSAIQAAIDASQSGDVIGVEAGTYTENLSLENREGLTLVGSDPETTILDASSGTDGRLSAILLNNSSDIEIRGLQITHSPLTELGEFHPAVWILGASRLNISDCIIQENAGAGFSVEGESTAAISNCQILNNGDSGALVQDNASATISDSTISDTSLAPDGIGGNGIYALGAPNLVLENVLIQNSANDGIDLMDGATAEVHSATINSNHGAGILITGASRLTLTESDVSQNRDSGLRLTDAAQAIVRESTLTGNNEHNIVTFGSSSLDVLNSHIQNALPNDEGNFGRGVAIVDASFSMTDSTISESSEFGLSLFGTANATITRSTISDSGDHGVLVLDSSILTAEASTVSGSALRGIGIFGTASATIRNSTIEENPAFTGIAFLEESSGLVEGSTIRRNGESGIWMSDQAEVTVTENEIVQWPWRRGRRFCKSHTYKQ